MVWSEFSETNYAFCLSFELCQYYQNGGFIVFPLFPTLHQEHLPGVGYDLAFLFMEESDPLVSSFFLQFKRPERVSKAKLELHKPTIGNEMLLRIFTESSQTQALRSNSQGPPMPSAYFVAARFHSISQLTDHFINHSISANSMYIAADRVPDDEDHCIYYTEQTEPENYQIFSERRDGSFLSLEQVIDEAKPIRISELVSLFTNELDTLPLKFYWPQFSNVALPELPFKLVKVAILLQIKYNLTLVVTRVSEA